MATLVNRAKMNVSAVNNASSPPTITLNAALAGFQTFASAGVLDQNTVSYVIEDGTNWEIGYGVYTAAGTILSRSTINASSNSGAAIAATTNATVFCSLQAADVLINSNANTFTGQQNFVEVALTDGATISWNLNTQQVAKVTIAGNRTLANPTNLVAGGTYVLRVIQDATGSRLLTYGANYKWANGIVPTLSTAANAVDILSFYSDGTYMYGCSQIGFA